MSKTGRVYSFRTHTTTTPLRDASIEVQAFYQSRRVGLRYLPTDVCVRLRRISIQLHHDRAAARRRYENTLSVTHARLLVPPIDSRKLPKKPTGHPRSRSSCLDRLPPTMFLLDAVRSRAWQPPLFRMQSRQRTPHVCRLLDTRPARPPSSTPRSGCRPPPVREAHKLLGVTQVPEAGRTPFVHLRSSREILTLPSGERKMHAVWTKQNHRSSLLARTLPAHYPPTRSIHRVSAQ